MNKYICTVCGYIFDESQGGLWADLPDNWTCPLCGADKSAFELQGSKEEEGGAGEAVDLDEDLRELGSHEMAAICSNLAKGCEKQYLAEESEAFGKLEAYLNQKNRCEEGIPIGDMVQKLGDEISSAFVKANTIADAAGDRGGKRALVWSEKVSRMLKSVLERYEAEGDAYLADVKVYVCDICGFMYIGNDLPAVCPVCKVPNFKMTEIGRE